MIRIDKDYYKKVMLIAVPIMIQNGITNFVNMLDNIMVGKIGTEQMTGVSIINQMMLVYNLMIFGGMAGIGIYTAQYAGKKDNEGIRITVRMKIILAAILSAIGLIIFLTNGVSLASLWLTGKEGGVDRVLTMEAARQYLLIICVGLIPFALSQICSGTLRENGETVVPMIAGIVAVVVNLTGNYVLIYGKFGAPVLGVAGAAIATVLSRFIELMYVLIWMMKNTSKYPFLVGIFAKFYIPLDLAKSIMIKAFPLLLNETLWSLGQTTLSQQYSTLGSNVVAAFNISSTISNVFNIAFIAMGESIAVLLGQELGTGKLGNVKKNANRLAVFSIILCLISGTGLFLISPFFPHIYNTGNDIRKIATGLIRISAVFMPVYAYENASYFTLRSGGKTWITFFFDCGFVWVCSIPAAFLLTRFSGFGIIEVYVLVQLADLIKAAIGYFMVRSGIWIQNLAREI
ncbi:MATE family efflux transporter [Butyrivibrio sp. NC3005]|uniref:MATE family efflux transporter n=1 Tax=Butyrivibrio sp. NC3005 TaxID=1280685 RepID=UPI000425F0E1|nr:MATE family efflux transporter [Butyrivibrio sp. NC3005]